MPIYTSVNVPVVAYANTFGDWVTTTNNLVVQNNNFTANNFAKPTGTLYLQDPTLGLQVNSAAIFAGAFQVVGTGSTAYIQNSLTANGQVYFSNGTQGLINSGTANILGTLFLTSPGNGVVVSNNALVSGNVNVTGYTNVTGNTFTNGVANFAKNTYVLQNSYANNFIGNTSITSPTVTVTGQLNGLGAAAQFGSVVVTGGVSVGGNFIINGTTIYNTNTFTLNAASGAPGQLSYFNVYRTAGANASIRWNDPLGYWDILDVNVGSYFQIVTTEQITGSTSTQSNILAASAYAVSNVQSTASAAFAKANVVLSQGGTVSANLTVNGILNVGNTSNGTFSANGTYQGLALPANAINDFSHTTLYPLMTSGYGANFPVYVSSSLFSFDSTTGSMYIPGGINGNLTVGNTVRNASYRIDSYGSIRSIGGEVFSGYGLRILNVGQTGGGYITANTAAAGGINIGGDAGAVNITGSTGTTTFTTDGKILVSNLHNNPPASSPAAGIITSGSYTPTFTFNAGVIAVSSGTNATSYIMVGKCMYIAGICTVTPSTANGSVSFYISLPTCITNRFPTTIIW